MKGSYKLVLMCAFSRAMQLQYHDLNPCCCWRQTLCVSSTNPAASACRCGSTSAPVLLGSHLLHGRRVALPRMHTLTPGLWLRTLPLPRGPCPFLPAWCIALTKVANPPHHPPSTSTCQHTLDVWHTCFDLISISSDSLCLADTSGVLVMAKGRFVNSRIFFFARRTC